MQYYRHNLSTMDSPLTALSSFKAAYFKAFSALTSRSFLHAQRMLVGASQPSFFRLPSSFDPVLLQWASYCQDHNFFLVDFDLRGPIVISSNFQPAFLLADFPCPFDLQFVLDYFINKYERADSAIDVLARIDSIASGYVHNKHTYSHQDTSDFSKWVMRFGVSRQGAIDFSDGFFLDNHYRVKTLEHILSVSVASLNKCLIPVYGFITQWSARDSASSKPVFLDFGGQYGRTADMLAMCTAESQNFWYEPMTPVAFQGKTTDASYIGVLPASEFFDIVLARHVFHHCPSAAIAEMAKTINKGGVLLVVDHHPDASPGFIRLQHAWYSWCKGELPCDHGVLSEKDIVGPLYQADLKLVIGATSPLDEDPSILSFQRQVTYTFVKLDRIDMLRAVDRLLSATVVNHLLVKCKMSVDSFSRMVGLKSNILKPLVSQGVVSTSLIGDVDYLVLLPSYLKFTHTGLGWYQSNLDKALEEHNLPVQKDIAYVSATLGLLRLSSFTVQQVKDAMKLNKEAVSFVYRMEALHYVKCLSPKKKSRNGATIPATYTWTLMGRQMFDPKNELGFESP